MHRVILWIILGGVALVAGVIVFQLLGTYLYLKSPDRVVNGAFSRLLDAKSFTVDLGLAQELKEGFSLNVKGGLDKQIITRPGADMVFSFQAAGQSFYGNGELKARDGEIYLRFDQVAGIPGLLPGALQSIWADLGMESLIAVGKNNLFPQASGNLTEADLLVLKEMVKKHIPVKATSKGDPSFIGLISVIHYRVSFDRAVFSDLALEVRAAIKGTALSGDEQKEIARYIATLPPINGEIWVAKNDGRLVALTLVAGSGETAVHANIRFSNYDALVAVDAPLSAKPLIEIIRRMIGNTLSGVTLKLPFEIPAPILNIEQKIPVVNLPVGGTGVKEDLGGLPDLLKLFYGTNQPFGSDIK